MRAKPLFICCLMTGIVSLPVTALALGLGKLTVQSSLGQPLSARIELTAAQKEELSTLAAKIADPSVFRDNNVQLSGTVSRARVSVEHGPNDAVYLKVTTTQAVNDPYLDLLVEVNWATGRVVRNYTFLLDPPGTTETQAIEPAVPVRTQQAASPARGARSESPSADQGSAPSVAAASTDGTYTVKRGDTLSKIARERKPESVSLEQMLVAMYRSNENAFDGKNMNRLRSGQILTVPAAEKVAAVAAADAAEFVKVQTSDWRTYRDRVAGAAPASEAEVNRQAAGGKITAAAEDKATAPQPGRDQLRLSREAGKGRGTSSAVALAEDTAAKEKALRDAQTRVAELEKTIRDMQEASKLRNQTMADLQRQADAVKAGKSGEPAKSEALKIAASAIAAATVPGPAPTVETKAAESKASEAKAAEPKAPETKTVETKAAEAKPSEAKAAENKAPEAKPAETKTAGTKAPAPKASPNPEPSFVDEFLANTPTWAVGGGALVVLGGIAAIVATRRRKNTKFEDSIISGTDIKTNTVFGSTGGGVVNTGENSLASDFSREGLGNIDTDEVDPIAEAEVYLAYGRDAQAEEILKDALKKDPQRQEIYLKLLEIHSQHNKPSAFETVASELYSVSGGQGEVWQKAMTIGRQLDPTNPLFTEAGSAAAFAAVAAAEAKVTPEAKAEATKDAVEKDAQASTPPELKSEVHAGKPLDFTLDEDISIAPAAAAFDAVAAAPQRDAEQPKWTRSHPDDRLNAVPQTASLLANADTIDIPRAPLHETVSFEPESIPKFDLDFNLDQPSRAGISSLPASKSRPLSSALEEAAVAMAAPGAAAPQLARPAAAIELDKLDLAFDPQRSTFEDPTPSVLDGQWHDAATKLDLAKAYQEMGDVEGAREILQEVLHEGDDQQKSEAQGLLAKLA